MTDVDLGCTDSIGGEQPGKAPTDNEKGGYKTQSAPSGGGLSVGTSFVGDIYEMGAKLIFDQIDQQTTKQETQGNEYEVNHLV